MARPSGRATGDTLTFSIPRAALGGPDWFEYSVAAGREAESEGAQSEDYAPGRRHVPVPALGSACRVDDRAAYSRAVTVARPLSVRVLGRLPGPQAAWIAAWALVPWLNAGANVLLDTDGTSAVWEQSRTLLLLNYASTSLAV